MAGGNVCRRAGGESIRSAGSLSIERSCTQGFVDGEDGVEDGTGTGRRVRGPSIRSMLQPTCPDSNCGQNFVDPGAGSTVRSLEVLVVGVAASWRAPRESSPGTGTPWPQRTVRARCTPDLFSPDSVQSPRRPNRCDLTGRTGARDDHRIFRQSPVSVPFRCPSLAPKRAPRFRPHRPVVASLSFPPANNCLEHHHTITSELH